jgi:hypothetical protein
LPGVPYFSVELGCFPRRHAAGFGDALHALAIGRAWARKSFAAFGRRSFHGYRFGLRLALAELEVTILETYGKSSVDALFDAQCTATQAGADIGARDLVSLQSTAKRVVVGYLARFYAAERSR